MERIYTPTDITNLKDNQVFVFGSNLNGNHLGGAARFAFDKGWVRWGTAEGMDDKEKGYAFPTLSKDHKILPDRILINNFTALLVKCLENPKKIFFLTKVGCGIAGKSEAEMRSLFKQAVERFGSLPENLIYPREFEFNDMTLIIRFDVDGVPETKVLIGGEPWKIKNLDRKSMATIMRALPKIRKEFGNEFIKLS